MKLEELPSGTVVHESPDGWIVVVADAVTANSGKVMRVWKADGQLLRFADGRLGWWRSLRGAKRAGDLGSPTPVTDARAATTQSTVIQRRWKHVTSERMREIVAKCDAWIDGGQFSTKERETIRRMARSARFELTRRHHADHCEVCGFDGDECGCGDNPSPVLVNEWAAGEVASA